MVHIETPSPTQNPACTLSSKFTPKKNQLHHTVRQGKTFNFIQKNNTIWIAKGYTTPGPILDKVYNEVKFERELFGDRVNNIYNNKDHYKYHEEGIGYCALGHDDLLFQAIRAGLNFWALRPKRNRRQFEKEDGEPSLTTSIEKMMEAMKESHEEVQGTIALTVNDPLINETNAFDIAHRRALQAMAESCTHTFFLEHVHFMKRTPQKNDECRLTRSTRPSGDKFLVYFASSKSPDRNFEKSKCKIFKMNLSGEDQRSGGVPRARTNGYSNLRQFKTMARNSTLKGKFIFNLDIYSLKYSISKSRNRNVFLRSYQDSLACHHRTDP